MAAELERFYTAYRRLKLAMDYWCALWFWPIPEASKLPTRDEFLFDMELVLKGTIQTPQPGAVLGELFPGEPVNAEHVAFVGRFGMVNVDEMLAKNERLRIVDEVAGRVRFHHWELRFADLFAEQGGFSLSLGNPPWVKIEWNESGLLGDVDPLVAMRDLSATEVAALRDGLLTTWERKADYFGDFVEAEGSKAFLSSLQTYPLLQGVQANLYKCFLAVSFVNSARDGIIAILHQKGLYDDTKAAHLRAYLIARLRWLLHFSNKKMLFDAIKDEKHYEISVASASPTPEPSFQLACNLFHPATVYASEYHDGLGVVPGIKTDEDEWDLRPHKSRIVPVKTGRLSLFARLYDKPDTPPTEARLPVVHSEEIVRVLGKFADQPKRLAALEGQFYTTVMFDETGSQRDGTLRRETRYPDSTRQWVLSGPHLFVGNPLYQTPNEGCSHNQDYSRLDLLSTADGYLPRTNYIPACSPAEYLTRTPSFAGKPVTDYYRHIHRRQLSSTGERTLINAIAPPGVAHIHPVISVTFHDNNTLLLFSGLASSIVYDFWIKTTGKSDLYESTLGLLPLPETSLAGEIRLRALRLNCVTEHYAPLWLATVGKPWDRECAFRTDQQRRQALVELDTLAALALDLTEEELVTIYRVQFPVLRQYERENLYDQTGRLVPKGVLDLAKRHNIDIRQPLHASTFAGPAELVGEVETPGLGVTGGIVWEDPKMEPRMKRVYPPPFTRCDREADMRQAYRAFQERLRSQEDAP